VNIWVP